MVLQQALNQLGQAGNPLTLSGPQYLPPEGGPAQVPDALRKHLSAAGPRGRSLLLFDEATQPAAGLRVFHQLRFPLDTHRPEDVLFHPLPPTQEEFAQALADGALPPLTEADHLWLDAEVVPEDQVRGWLPGVRPAVLRITSSAFNKIASEGPGAIGALIRAAEWARRNGVTLTVEDAAVEALRGYRVIVLTAA